MGIGPAREEELTLRRHLERIIAYEPLALPKHGRLDVLNHHDRWGVFFGYIP